MIEHKTNQIKKLLKYALNIEVFVPVFLNALDMTKTNNSNNTRRNETTCDKLVWNRLIGHSQGICQIHITLINQHGLELWKSRTKLFHKSIQHVLFFELLNILLTCKVHNINLDY